MRRPLPTILLALLPALASCATAPPPLPPIPDDPFRCGLSEYIGHYLDVVPAIARQGTTLALSPKQVRGPGGTYDVPLDCTSDWSLSDPALATLSGDRATILIAADARPGATLGIAYTVANKRVEAALAIIGRDQVVLSGTRGQKNVQGCASGEPVRELVFTSEGGFAVTFLPFETYKDYWGRYTFDPASGALVMTVAGGNHVPAGLDLEGRASLGADGSLVLEGIYLGNRQGIGPGALPAGGCTYTFG